MFLNSDFFKYDEQSIMFEDIAAYYHQETKHFTNGIYEGTNLRLTLKLKNRVKPYTIEINGNQEQKYKAIITLSQAIASYRTKKILEAIESQIPVVFESLNGLKIEYRNNEFLLSDTPVKAVLEKNILYFECKDGKKEKIYADTISDIACLMQLLSTKNYFRNNTRQIEQKNRRLYIVFMIFLVLFGLNGFFELCCMKFLFVDVISTLSMILLGVVVFTAPMYLLVARANAKKTEKEYE
jgi:hypothetical protein